MLLLLLLLPWALVEAIAPTATQLQQTFTFLLTFCHKRT